MRSRVIPPHDKPLRRPLCRYDFPLIRAPMALASPVLQPEREKNPLATELSQPRERECACVWRGGGLKLTWSGPFDFSYLHQPSNELARYHATQSTKLVISWEVVFQQLSSDAEASNGAQISVVEHSKFHHFASRCRRK